MQRQNVQAPRALPNQFHWRVRDRASTQSPLRAIPNAASCRQNSSCECSAGCFADSLDIVQGVNFRSIARIDGGAAKFAGHGEQAVLAGAALGNPSEGADVAAVTTRG